MRDKRYIIFKPISYETRGQLNSSVLILLSNFKNYANHNKKRMTINGHL